MATDLLNTMSNSDTASRMLSLINDGGPKPKPKKNIWQKTSDKITSLFTETKAEKEKVPKSGIVVNTKTGESIITDEQGNSWLNQMIVGKNNKRATSNPVPYMAFATRKPTDKVFIDGKEMSPKEAKKLYNKYEGGTTPLGNYVIGKMSNDFGYTEDKGYPKNAMIDLKPIKAFGQKKPKSSNEVKVKDKDGNISYYSSSAAIHSLPRGAAEYRTSLLNNKKCGNNASAGCMQWKKNEYKHNSETIAKSEREVDTVSIINPSIRPEDKKRWDIMKARLNNKPTNNIAKTVPKEIEKEVETTNVFDNAKTAYNKTMDEAGELISNTAKTASDYFTDFRDNIIAKINKPSIPKTARPIKRTKIAQKVNKTPIKTKPKVNEIPVKTTRTKKLVFNAIIRD